MTTKKKHTPKLPPQKKTFLREKKMPRRTPYGNLMDEVDEPLTPGAMLIGLVFLIALVIATGVVIGLALSQKETTLPSPIDIVVYETPESVPVLEPQLTAIVQNMPFRNNIYILTSNPARANGPANLTNISQAFFARVTLTGTTQEEVVREFFNFIPQLKDLSNVPNIADHFLFLGNQTVPFRTINTSTLFYNKRPRAFNVFRDTAEVTTLSPFFTYTAPCFVAQTKFAGVSIENFLLLSISQDRIVLRNDFMRDIFVNQDTGELQNNYNIQFSELVRKSPLFASFHVTGQNQTSAFEDLGRFLKQEFYF